MMINWYQSMVPRACFFFDSNLKSTLGGFEVLAYGSETDHQRKLAEEDLQRLWINDDMQYSILPCLSVRSGLDLYLSVKAFPRGSELIMSSVNIPTIVNIIHHHGLKIRSCDINLSTMAPSHQHLKRLINKNTVAVLVAHIYGRRFDMDPIIEICKLHSIPVLEDCAEAFCGIKFSGHPESDLSFFSFGSIKLATAFGGGIVRIRDRKLYENMKSRQDEYPVQTHGQYAAKLAKYAIFTAFFNNSFFFKHATGLFRLCGVDHKEVFVPFLRGFPTDLINGIRHKPSVYLLNNLTFRLLSFTDLEYKISQDKGAYVMEQLPPEAGKVGEKAHHVGHWLFPILVEHPALVTAHLNQLGVDASLSTTQLKIVEDDLMKEKSDDSTIPQASFLMKQVVYLPVHKLATYDELDRIITAVKKSVHELGGKQTQVRSRLSCKARLDSKCSR